MPGYGTVAPGSTKESKGDALVLVQYIQLMGHIIPVCLCSPWLGRLASPYFLLVLAIPSFLAQAWVPLH